MGPSALTLSGMFYKEQSTGYRIQPHVRKYWQWYCVVHGDVVMEVEKRPVLLGPCTAILVPPQTERAPRCHQRAPAYVLAEFDHALPLEPLASRALPLPLKLRKLLFALVDELTDYEHEDHGAMAYGLFLQLVVGQVREARSGAGRGRKPVGAPSPGARDQLQNLPRAEETVRRLELLLTRRFRERLSRAELAKAVGLSPSQCARVYKAVTGKTLLGRLTGLRMGEAKALLLESTLAVGDIGMELGFDSFSHFSQAFRLHTGVSPSEYRGSGGRVYPTGRD